MGNIDVSYYFKSDFSLPAKGRRFPGLAGEAANGRVNRKIDPMEEGQAAGFKPRLVQTSFNAETR